MVDLRRCNYCGTLKKLKFGYCGDRCRLAALSAFQRGEYQVSACEYCGMPADTVDHIPPRSVRQFICDSGLQGRFPFKIVSSCRECNTLLIDRDLWTLRERIEFIKKELRRRYRKHLSVADWTDNEISELGFNLQKAVQHGMVMSELIKYRIGWRQ
jgi:hypothetical protein